MSGIQNMSKSAVRIGKNYIKGYTDVQVKVRDATSNDPWGPSGQQMNELAQLSYDQNEFIEIMEIMDKRLNDKGKNWRHVFKSLTLLDYLLHAGSENCVIYFRDNIYIVKTLREFVYIDEAGKDQGANVRQKAKDITNLLEDEARLREERKSRAHMRERMTTGDGEPTGGEGDAYGQRKRQDEAQRRRQKEEDELAKAIEESKRMARENEEKIRREAKDEEELERALKISREEEEARIKALEERTKNALFDDSLNLDGPNAYKDTDMWGNPLVNVNGGMNASLQPQYTSFNPYMQQQQTGFNPFLQQQMQEQAAMQAQWQQQQQQWELQQAAQQYQQLMMQNTAQPMQQLQPQKTAFGSNNPFASFGGGAGPSHPQQQQHNVPVGDLFSSEPTPQPQQAPPPQSPQQLSHPLEQPASPAGPPRVKTDNSSRFAELNRLLASGDGIDTFGNTGDMRMGHGARSSLLQQQTGAAAMGQAAFGSPGGPPANGNGAAKPAEQPFFNV